MKINNVLENKKLNSKTSLMAACIGAASLILLILAVLLSDKLPNTSFFTIKTCSFLTDVAQPFLHWVGVGASADAAIPQITEFIVSHPYLAALLLSFSLSSITTILAAPYVIAAVLVWVLWRR